MIAEGLHHYRGKRVLLLQGPLGPFFTRVAADLHREGAIVYKINFNGGDWLFSLGGPWQETINFTQSLGEWPDFFRDLLLRLQIDEVFLFGDCRPMHVPVTAISRRLGVAVGVFEEGYLRPDYITFERGGVNNRSTLPGDPDFYRARAASPTEPTRPVGNTFRHAALWGVLYYTAASLGKPVFRRYWHHRRLGATEGIYWCQSFYRKLRYKRSEQAVAQRLLDSDSNYRFFLVPLQTCGDAQIKVHSRFRSIPRFIEHVLYSFARSAPADAALVIKHHPLDRGYTDYSVLIARLAKRLGLESRCHYIHDQHLPTLLRNAEGVVVVNSTVGLSAVGEGVPVKVCGEAIYDMSGLTFQGDLDGFWEGASAYRADGELWNAFRTYLISRTQINGSFYRKIAGIGSRTGVAWASLAGEATAPAPRPEMPAGSAAATAALLAAFKEASPPVSARPRTARAELPIEELASAN